VADRLATLPMLEIAVARCVRKTDAVEVFRVMGYLDEKGQPVRLETPTRTIRLTIAKVHQIAKALGVRRSVTALPCT